MSNPNDAFEDLAQGAAKEGCAPPGKQVSQLDFELEFFERVLEQQPDYVDVLRVHGNNLTAKGLYARGLETDRRLVRLRPNDALVHYNLACSYSLMQMNDAAMSALDQSLSLGYRDFEHMMTDPDLEHVRSDARFLGLVGPYLRGTGGRGQDC